MKGYRKAILLAVWLAVATPLGAKPGDPYLVSATLHVSVDDWADIWLNGRQIVMSQPRTGEGKGHQEIIGTRESLCLFKDESVLAIEADDRSNPKDPAENYVGIAYVLVLVFSDGSRKVLTSDEVSEHRAFHVSDRMVSNPIGWQRPSFNDLSWPAARVTGSKVPGLATVDHPSTGGKVQFLSAASSSSRSEAPGERHLFRRRLSLNVSERPDCEEPAPIPTRARPKPSPTTVPVVATPTEPPREGPEPPALTATWTPEPPTPTPTWTPWPELPTATWTPETLPPDASVVPEPTWTPIPIAPTPMAPLPTATWTVVPSVRRELPTATATATPMKIRRQEGAISPVEVPVLPTLVPTSVPTPVERPAAVFSQGSVNLLITFADGAGDYRAEVQDADGDLLQVILDERIPAQGDRWLEWDGMGREGEETPLGRYYLVLYKDGKPLKKILIIRVGR